MIRNHKGQENIKFLTIISLKYSRVCVCVCVGEGGGGAFISLKYNRGCLGGWGAFMRLLTFLRYNCPCSWRCVHIIKKTHLNHRIYVTLTKL